jgi:hypothetical protein
MKKIFKSTFSVFLTAVMILSMACFASAVDETKSDYKIISPYEDVIWSGENAWGAYKGNLHTHSYVSDADVDLRDMIIEYYNQGFDFLAMTEHGVTGKAWNEKQAELPLYFYQRIIGNKVHTLTDEEYKAITTGTYEVNGKSRSYGMTCVIGGNELNALTATKCHVNGFFLPEGVGDNYLGYENDYEGAVKLADDTGAYSVINHPGDWLDSNTNRAAVSDPENVEYFGKILLKYDSCLGMEVFNEKNATTPYDRVLWDNLLMYCLPYGKRVIGFSNGDTHSLNNVNSSFSVFMMEENTVENIKKAMVSGAFFMVTRMIRSDSELGPKEDMDKRTSFDPYPTFNEVTVDGHKIRISVKDCYNIQWVANGKVIASEDITQSSNSTEYVLDLDTIDGAEDFLYVRCQLTGTDGITLTQALEIDNGAEKLNYEEDNSTSAKVDRFLYKFFSLRIFVFADEIYKLIAGVVK